MRRNSSEAPSETYERVHWGEVGSREVRRMRVPDPRSAPLVVLGRLRRVEYETDKGDGEEVFFHDFGRLVVDGEERGRVRLARCPLLVFSEEGLFIAGGRYSIETGGIVG